MRKNFASVFGETFSEGFLVDFAVVFGIFFMCTEFVWNHRLYHLFKNLTACQLIH